MLSYVLSLQEVFRSPKPNLKQNTNRFQEAELSWREISHFDVIKTVAPKYCGD